MRSLEGTKVETHGDDFQARCISRFHTIAASSRPLVVPSCWQYVVAEVDTARTIVRSGVFETPKHSHGRSLQFSTHRHPQEARFKLSFARADHPLRLCRTLFLAREVADTAQQANFGCLPSDFGMEQIVLQLWQRRMLDRESNRITRLRMS